MTGGKNGSTPLQNLTQMRRKPVFDTPAPLELTKCPAHPTKRMWANDVDAIREAEVRSTAAKMPISAYRCNTCGNAHLCKTANAHPGSILARPEPELRLVLGNGDAKRKVLSGFLEDRAEARTDELCELLGVGRGSLAKYMNELGWRNTLGRSARWIRDTPVELKLAPTAAVQPVEKPVERPIDLANFEVFKGKGMSARNLKALDEAQSRHPASVNAGWRPVSQLDRIRHLPIGDLMDTLEVLGLELRLMIREKKS